MSLISATLELGTMIIFKCFYLVCGFFVLLAFVVNYLFECEKCVKSCVMFNDWNANECVVDCKCADNRFNNWLNWYHVDDYSYKLTDDPICVNNYDETPLILKNKKIKNKTKPNIVLIVMDDGSNYVDPMFEAMPFSKKLFELNGTEFVNAFTSTSFCCPARCQIFTGMYGHNNGVISSSGSYSSMNAFLKPLYLNGSRQINQENGKCINNLYRSINVYLKQQNYTNGMFGKYLNGHESSHPRFHSMKFVPPGWDQFDMCVNNYMYTGNMYVMSEWNAIENKVRYKWYGREEKDYLTDVIGRKSVKFIRDNRNNNNKNPLFMYVASTAPHGPMTSAYRHRDKLKLWDDKFDKYIASRPNYHSAESIKTKSSWIKKLPNRDELLNLTPLYHSKTPVNVHRVEFRRRMGSYYALDEMIKSIYDEIELRGELENTIWILTSDNGLSQGAHGKAHKMDGYEESIRVPLFIAGGQFKKGHKDLRLVTLHDIAPTLLDTVGLYAPDHMDGISLLDDTSNRNSVLLEYGKRKDGEEYTGNLKDVSEFKVIADIAPDTFAYDVNAYVGIRTVNYTLIEYYDQLNKSNSEFELYDLTKDPYQIYNLVYNGTFHSEMQNLKERLAKLEVCEGINCNTI